MREFLKYIFFTAVLAFKIGFSSITVQSVEAFKKGVIGLSLGTVPYNPRTLMCKKQFLTFHQGRHCDAACCGNCRVFNYTHQYFNKGAKILKVFVICLEKINNFTVLMMSTS